MILHVFCCLSACDNDCLPTVDQEFDSVSCFLLKRTKDMVNKYRQLLVREAQVRLISTVNMSAADTAAH